MGYSRYEKILPIYNSIRNVEREKFGLNVANVLSHISNRMAINWMKFVNLFNFGCFKSKTSPVRKVGYAVCRLRSQRQSSASNSKVLWPRKFPKHESRFSNVSCLRSLIHRAVRMMKLALWIIRPSKHSAAFDRYFLSTYATVEHRAFKLINLLQSRWLYTL